MSTHAKVLYDALKEIASQSFTLRRDMELYDNNIEAARKAIKEYESLRIADMKVFKMNDCDWVAHYSEEEAKAFYSDFTGISMEDIEEEFEGECTNGWMYWDKDEADRLEPEHDFEHEEDSPFGDCYRVPFKWVIKNYPMSYPGCIATTEC